jgi:Flp pilus assembly protein TadD
MSKMNYFCLIIVLTLVACGPETIFVRPYLDTPDLHVHNGNLLIQQKKWADANREFQRAAELDPAHTEAYIGLGMVLALSGDLEQGRLMLYRAEEMVKNEDERAAVTKAFGQLQRLERDQRTTH